MKQKNSYQKLLPILSLIIASMACQSIMPPSNVQSILTTPTPKGLANSIIGLWEYKNEENNEEMYIAFNNNGKLTSGGGNLVNYEVISENTILVIYDGEEHVWHVRELNGNNLTLELPDQGIYEFQRVEAVPNLAEAIIGLWLVKGTNDTVELVIEFTPTNKVITNSSIGIGEYRVVSNNSVELYNLSGQPENFTTTVQIVKGNTNNSLAFYIELGYVFDMVHVEEHQNLSERIVGTWRNELGEELKLTANGRFISRDVVGDYEVVSNNTIIIKYETALSVYNIVNLTNDTLTLDELESPYSADPVTFTRVQP